MIATATEDCFSYIVSSEAGSKPYNVCLLANNGNGQCDCPSWQFRCSPAIARGEKAACKHTRAARLQLAEDIITRKVESDRKIEVGVRLVPPLDQYKEIAKIFLSENNECGVGKCERDGWVDVATQVHHSRGRLGSLLKAVEFFIPSCASCHAWVHNNPNEARKLNWKGVPVLCERGKWNRFVDISSPRTE